MDRTEVHGTSKWYIEVKANVLAACQHRKQKKRNQLSRLTSVVDQRRAKNEQTKHPMEERQSAVSIVCPDEWGRLFVQHVAEVYAGYDIHLMIGGVLFTPDELKQIAGAVLAIIDSPETTKELIDRIVATFPLPEQLKAQGCKFTESQLAAFKPAQETT